MDPKRKKNLKIFFINFGHEKQGSENPESGTGSGFRIRIDQKCLIQIRNEINSNPKH